MGNEGASQAQARTARSALPQPMRMRSIYQERFQESHCATSAIILLEHARILADWGESAEIMLLGGVFAFTQCCMQIDS
jgi:hypothetical protein